MFAVKRLVQAATVVVALGFSTTAVLADDWVKAEVKAIDLEQVKITLKHEPLTEFEMPAMTMVFRVTDPAKLEGLAEGDQVEFVAGKENGQMVVKDVKKN